MSSHILKYLRLSAAAVVAAGTASAYAAETAPGQIGQVLNIDQVQQMVDSALPPILGGDNSELLGLLSKPRLGPALSQTFSPQTALHAVFGPAGAPFDLGCSRTGTTVGEPDQGDCSATAGTPSGKGGLKQLSFSKNIAVGNIRFLFRQPDTGKPNFTPVDLADGSALKAATDFLTKNFGLPAEEFPLPPTPPGGVPNLSGFVSSLTIQGQGTAGAAADVTPPTVIGKLVHIRRGLFVRLPTDANGNTQAYVPAPGVANVLIGQGKNAAGAPTPLVLGAMVENWRELRPDPNVNASRAKSRQALTNEIVQDLLGDGGARIAHMSAHIVYTSDCRSAGFCYLVPAVQVYVAPATGQLNADHFKLIEGEKIGVTGFVREYLLASPDPELLPTR
jgi:hypothetical protein